VTHNLLSISNGYLTISVNPPPPVVINIDEPIVNVVVPYFVNNVRINPVNSVVEIGNNGVSNNTGNNESVPIDVRPELPKYTSLNHWALALTLPSDMDQLTWIVQRQLRSKTISDSKSWWMEVWFVLATFFP